MIKFTKNTKVSTMSQGYTGFTLAEVLITLTIIGVVAALTVPNLYAYYQKTQYVTQLKKVYSEISQAIKLLMADEGVNKLSASNTLTFDEVSDYDEFIQGLGDNFFKKYFKVIKDCGTGYECFANNYKTIDENNFSGITCSYSVIIASGASICTSQIASPSMPGDFFVDINGLNPPNVAGRDLFSFSYYHDGSIDSFVSPECRKGVPNSSGLLCFGHNSPKEARDYFFDNGEGTGCLKSTYGVGCFAKILNDNWKMDY
ncbi:MAG TPA: type II secretion system protein [Candidatus Gastranaerophilaceae bacterium]|nr:type II secretion system protein [Candidatus Gastranaerophilaceae bacterium]HPT41390.1 type II secretion system protein [Candidatus Gastranaerophilaceae bacterium]